MNDHTPTNPRYTAETPATVPGELRTAGAAARRVPELDARVEQLERDVRELLAVAGLVRKPGV